VNARVNARVSMTVCEYERKNGKKGKEQSVLFKRTDAQPCFFSATFLRHFFAPLFFSLHFFRATFFQATFLARLFLHHFFYATLFRSTFFCSTFFRATKNMVHVPSYEISCKLRTKALNTCVLVLSPHSIPLLHVPSPPKQVC